MPKVIEMYSIYIYITCVSLVIAASNATNKSDYEKGEQNVIEDKELIMRDEQRNDKKEPTKDRVSLEKGKKIILLFFFLNLYFLNFYFFDFF